MNRKQKITMWVAVGVLALMLLVPPWKVTIEGAEAAAGYSLVFMRPRSLVVVDIPRLVLPMCAVAIVAAGLLVTFRSRKGE